MAKGIKTGGRQKGTPNKVTGTVREAVARALDELGGSDWFVKLAKEHPPAFATLVGRVMPLQVSGTDDGPVRLEVVTGVPRDDED